MVEFVEVAQADRPEVAQEGEWTEVLVLPYDRAMARPFDDGWLQWRCEECIVVPGWAYALLALAWPLLRLIDRRPLRGRRTDY